MGQLVLGLSSCLMGETVRYDGRHKYNAYIVEDLGKHFSFQQFCPEVAIGLGIPREPIHLVEVDGEIRCRGTESKSLDVTEQLQQYADEQRAPLNKVLGYIFKKGSPSCGIKKVKLIKDGREMQSGTGIFAQRVSELFPGLPLADEEDLYAAESRVGFIRRVFVYKRWRELLASAPTAEGFIAFHSSLRRYLIHCVGRDREELELIAERIVIAGKAVGSSQRFTRETAKASFDNYITVVMEILSRKLPTNSLETVMDSVKHGIVLFEEQSHLREPVAELKEFIQQVVDGESEESAFLEFWRQWAGNYLHSDRRVAELESARDLIHCCYLNPAAAEFSLLSSALNQK